MQPLLAPIYALILEAAVAHENNTQHAEKATQELALLLLHKFRLSIDSCDCCL